jgi:uncharacterized membrane protein
MPPFPEGTYAALIVWLAVLAVLAVVGVYAIRKLRDGGTAAPTRTSDLMTNFQQLHDRGELTDAEYRTIKAMLSERLHDEVNDNGQSP